jgi:hypothetical protein
LAVNRMYSFPSKIIVSVSTYFAIMLHPGGTNPVWRWYLMAVQQTTCWG